MRNTQNSEKRAVLLNYKSVAFQKRRTVMTRCPHPEHPYSLRSALRIPTSFMFVEIMLAELAVPKGG